MSPGLIGGLIGALIGFGGFAAIRGLAGRIERSRPGADGARTAGLMRTTALLNLVLFTVAGYGIGAYFLSGQ